MDTGKILVTGATGYVGGRLIPRLLAAGYEVRAMARSRTKIECRPWVGHPLVEVVTGDVLNLEDLCRATRGCRTAYYLVHSMEQGRSDFASPDRDAARNMAAAAAREGLERIIYLGGLGDENAGLSRHLQSRMEVGRILQSGTVPATVLRAAMILGSGSASFEILRYLVDRLPVMVTPRWVFTPNQPIAIRNVLAYLVGCLEHEETAGETFDIGGPEVLDYRELMKIYASEAGLARRWIIPVPVLTPKLSSYWIHLVTPVPASLAKPLAEGLRNPVVCQEDRIRSIIPQELLSCRQAIRFALDRLQQEKVETCWTDAGELRPPEWVEAGDAPYAGGTVLECVDRIRIQADAEAVWHPIVTIGGRKGWYYCNTLWVFRGLLDRLVGGKGLRRGRRSQSELLPGDALDFWRVLEARPTQRLLLLAEMKLPGEATLEFRIIPGQEGCTELVQISRFLPKGLFGILYWYALVPFHKWIFRGMLRAIARQATAPTLEDLNPSKKKSCPDERSKIPL